uniref:Calmodulin-like n=1 Tax=Saccoglossus kowalevskii TaxID=10224 RepID=A0ABM0MNN2_SACKO|nr:PREDICTED: calmodulin-like [Saccoglossus kowalevskii]
MAHELAQTEVVEFTKIFTTFDKDGDGHIRKSELREILVTLGHEATDADIATLIAEVDTDDDGAINHAEFLALMAKKIKEPITDEELANAFKVFDKDGSGLISAAEIRSVLANLGLQMADADVEKWIRLSDHSGDGQVDYKEFVKMMQ